jgi:hypothetical protein
MRCHQECAVTKEARGSCNEDAACDRFVDKLSSGARLLLSTRALVTEVDISMHPPDKDGSLLWDLYPENGVIASTDTIYTDGSMIDGSSKSLGRVGFGFAAYNEDGQLTAKAYGTPPAWIDTVPGAETWALAAAIEHSMAGVKIWSDCKSVVNRLKGGRAAATCSSVKLARVWSKIFDLCEDRLGPAQTLELDSTERATTQLTASPRKEQPSTESLDMPGRK